MQRDEHGNHVIDELFLPHLLRIRKGDRFAFDPFGYGASEMVVSHLYWDSEFGGDSLKEWIVWWEEGMLYPGMNNYANVCQMVIDGELVKVEEAK